MSYINPITHICSYDVRNEVISDDEDAEAKKARKGSLIK
jgi:hypothetical protein